MCLFKKVTYCKGHLMSFKCFSCIVQCWPCAIVSGWHFMNWHNIQQQKTLQLIIYSTHVMTSAKETAKQCPRYMKVLKMTSPVFPSVTGWINSRISISLLLQWELLLIHPEAVISQFWHCSRCELSDTLSVLVICQTLRRCLLINSGSFCTGKLEVLVTSAGHLFRSWYEQQC